jgi:hypothetical protein
MFPAGEHALQNGAPKLFSLDVGGSQFAKGPSAWSPLRATTSTFCARLRTLPPLPIPYAARSLQECRSKSMADRLGFRVLFMQRLNGMPTVRNRGLGLSGAYGSDKND